MAILLIAIIPGGIYIWTVERIVGRWGVGFSDRLFRFIGVSVGFHVLIAPVTYAIWYGYLRHGARLPESKLPLWLWPVALAFVLVPACVGILVGAAYRRGDRWAKLVSGSAAPTAWDALFGTDPAGWVLMRLKSGAWVGGAYAAGSYSGGFPEPADIFLSEEYRVDQDSGEFEPGADRNGVPVGYGLLVRWDEIEYLEFAPTSKD
jgi:hypothetical protein